MRITIIALSIFLWTAGGAIANTEDDYVEARTACTTVIDATKAALMKTEKFQHPAYWGL